MQETVGELLKRLSRLEKELKTEKDRKIRLVAEHNLRKTTTTTKVR